MTFDRTPNLEWDGMQELAEVNQWVAWKPIKRKDKITKPPYQITGKPADITNRSHFSSVKQVCDFIMDRDGEEWGAGFALTEDDPYVVIDIDKCIDPGSGAFDAGIKSIIERFDTFTEISPSGRGFHILCKGKLPPSSWHKNADLGFEIYDCKRYITVTGTHYTSTPETIEERQKEIDWFLGKYRPSAQTPSIKHDDVLGENVPFNIELNPDAKAPQNKLNALLKNNAAFRKLWKKERPEFADKSASEWDMALCYHMAAAKWKHQEMADALIEYRTYWESGDESDKVINRVDYHERTQKKALEAVKKNYTDFSYEIEKAIDEGDDKEKLSLFCKETGIPCDRIFRRGIDPVRFYFNIGGRDVSLGGGKELLNQNHVRAKVMESTGRILKIVSAKVWHQILKLLYAASEFEEFSEADRIGSFLSFVSDYLDNQSNLFSEDRKNSIKKKWPFIEDGNVYISAEEFHRFCFIERGIKIDINELRYQLREAGFTSKQMTVRKKPDSYCRSYWCMEFKKVRHGKFIADSGTTGNGQNGTVDEDSEGRVTGDGGSQVGDDMLTDEGRCT